MEDNRRIRVAITHGDTNGIGYELIFKTFAAPEMLELCTPIIYGSPKVATYHRKALDIPASFSIINDAREAREGRVNLLTCMGDEIKVELGVPTPESNQAAMQALDRAISDYRNGLFDVLVTCPVDERHLESGGVKFGSQQAYIETCLGEGRSVLPVYVGDALTVALATDNLALRDVPQALTPARLEERIGCFYNTLRRDFRLSNPRVAVLSLNPDNGEFGNFDREEQEVIAPTVSKLAENGVNVFGPYSADEIFSGSTADAFDGLLAMYHDQGLPPFKAREASEGVRLMAGLSVVCTAPESNVAFSIAGRNVADETAFRHAIFLAIDVWRNRQEYDEPLAHPLKKLYHEKKDDSEKVRFSIPKKHENAILERAPKTAPTPAPSAQPAQPAPEATDGGEEQQQQQDE